MQLIAIAAVDAAVAAALGFAIPKWPAVLIAGALWPLYVLSRTLSLWGHGVGDGWLQALVVLTITTLLATALGVVLRRRLTGADRRPSSSASRDTTAVSG
jgi:hypothetical protein